MKLKPGWDEFVDEEMPAELRARVIERTRDVVADADTAGNPGWLWKPLFAGTLLAAGLAVVLIARPGSGPAREAVPSGVAQEDREFLRNLDLLKDLKLLRKLADTEKTRKKWPKRKS